MLIILEILLNVIDGHERTQILAVDQLSKRTDITILTANIKHGFDDPRVVSTFCSRNMRSEDEQNSLKHDCASLKDVLASNTSNQPAVILIPTTFSYDVRLAFAILRDSPSAARFFMRFISDRPIDSLAIEERQLLHRYVKSGHITLLTEEESLARHLNNLYDLSVRPDLILPCMTSDYHAPPSINRNRAHRDHFRLGYLGGLRAEKGLALLPHILRSLNKNLKDSEPDMRIDFVTSTYPQKKKNRQKNRHYNYDLFVNTFRLFTPRQITVTKLSAILTSEEFAKEISQMDALLVPYRLKDYQNRGSGIITDGVWLGKPIIYTRGIGMSEFLKFGNAEAATSPEEFAEKIIAVFKNIKDYQNHAQEAQQALKERFLVTADLLKNI